MDIISINGKTTEDKLNAIYNHFPIAFNGSILDIGCRTKSLEKLSSDRYYGLDLIPPASIIGNLERGLPFKSRSIHSVAAIDILEHTNDIYYAFEELCRVSNNYVIICLPNLYEFRTRIDFFFGRSVSGKYGLTKDPPSDRHRWFFPFTDAYSFIHYRSSLSGFTIIKNGILLGSRMRNLIPDNIILKYKNFWALWYVAYLKRIL